MVDIIAEKVADVFAGEHVLPDTEHVCVHAAELLGGKLGHHGLKLPAVGTELPVRVALKRGE
jgi:hypothetical protein